MAPPTSAEKVENSSTIEKPVKVKKIAAKKPQTPKSVQKPKAVKVEKKTVAPKKVLKSSFDRLNAHALKHVSSWHAKAGADGPQFAKLLAKHARSLLK